MAHGGVGSPPSAHHAAAPAVPGRPRLPRRPRSSAILGDGFREMADDGASGAGGSTARDGSDGPESATIEINIKTLESQVHKLRVAKNETVLNLKEKIVDVAGIPVEQQRLIFRGRVLKDDHLLSEYHQLKDCICTDQIRTQCKVTSAVYVFRKSWSPSADNRLLVAAILLFIFGTVKCIDELR